MIFVTDGRAWPALGNVSLFRRTSAAQKLVHVGELSAEPPAPHRQERMRIRRVALPLVYGNGRVPACIYLIPQAV